MIKKITIEGFRGINLPLVLNFESGKSLIIYGRNGTGKSSITDAWEWFLMGKIKHLAREGAGEQSYPHKYAKGGRTFIEVEFLIPELEKIKVTYNPNRITSPKVSGNINALKSLIPYPCYLRYRDLTEFVYMTKAQRYEFLSRYMGFEKAVNVQNSMIKCSNKLKQLIENLGAQRERIIQECKRIIGIAPRLDSILEILNSIFEKYHIDKQAFLL